MKKSSPLKTYMQRAHSLIRSAFSWEKKLFAWHTILTIAALEFVVSIVAAGAIFFYVTNDTETQPLTSQQPLSFTVDRLEGALSSVESKHIIFNQLRESIESVPQDPALYVDENSLTPEDQGGAVISE